VKWFHRAKGFGFVTRDDTKEDLFVHYTSLLPISINPARAKKRLNLMDKEKVKFDVVKSNKDYLIRIYAMQ
jgi:Y-box-binding protein 1